MTRRKVTYGFAPQADLVAGAVEVDGTGMRFASFAGDLLIAEADRKYRWPLGRRPDDRPGLSELGL